jgi:Uncharacterised nucleotidyltransferase
MSYRVGHPPLSSAGYAWLSVLSNPDMEYPIAGKMRSHGEIAWLAEAASAHGVLPVFTRNLRKFMTTFDASSILVGPQAEETISRTLCDLDERLTLITGRSLLLTHYQRQISLAIEEKGLDAAIIKGPVFARRLYEKHSDRSFTDIDILVDPRSLQATIELVSGLGFVEGANPTPQRKAQSEFKWVLPGNDSILIEIQTNLIHSADANRGIRLTYADLLAAGEGNPEDATALLLVAAVHGLVGHQLERLQPAVDVLQAVRGKGGPIDESRLLDITSALGATKALQTALDVVGAIFTERRAADLADLFAPCSWRRLRATLLAPTVVLRSQASDAGRDSWRRKIIRKIVN